MVDGVGDIDGNGMLMGVRVVSVVARVVSVVARVVSVEVLMWWGNIYGNGILMGVSVVTVGDVDRW